MYLEHTVSFFSILDELTQKWGRVSAKMFYDEKFEKYDTSRSALRSRKTVFKRLLMFTGKVPSEKGRVPLNDLENIFLFLKSPGCKVDVQRDQDHENVDGDQDHKGRGGEKNVVEGENVIDGPKENAKVDQGRHEHDLNTAAVAFNDKADGNDQGRSNPTIDLVYVEDEVQVDNSAAQLARVVDYCKETIVPYMKENVYLSPATGMISVAAQCATPDSFLDHTERVFFKLSAYVSLLEEFAEEEETSSDAHSAANRAISFCFATQSMFLFKMGRPKEAGEALGRALEVHPTSGAVYCRMVQTANMAITCTNKQEALDAFRDLYQDASFGLDNDPFASLVRSLIKNMKQSLGASIMAFDPIHKNPEDVVKAFKSVVKIRGPTLGYRNWELALLIAKTTRSDPRNLGQIKNSLENGANLLERAMRICDEHL
jgi:hypothetical protein